MWKQSMFTSIRYTGKGFLCILNRVFVVMIVFLESFNTSDFEIESSVAYVYLKGMYFHKNQFSEKFSKDFCAK